MASYSAGSAGLRIFPDLTGFQQKLTAATAGTYVTVGVRTDQAAIRSFASELNGLTRNVTVTINADGTRARNEIRAVENEGRRFGARSWTANLTVSAAGAIRTAATAAVAINQFTNKKYTFNVDADTTGAVASVLRLTAIIAGLGGGIGVIGGLVGALGGIAPAAGGALLGLVPLIQAFSGVGKAVTALGAQQAAAGAEAGKSAQQQAQAANSLITAQLAVTRASRAASEAQSDGARDVAQAQRRATESVNQAKEAAVEAGKAITSAQRDVKAAVQGVTDAQRTARDAARDVQTAERDQASAATDLASRTRELKIAQDAINGAWVDGQRALQDLQDQMDGVNLDQRQNALDLKDAADELAKARTTGDPTGIARAQLAYDRLIEQQDVLAKRYERVNQANTEGQAAGVAGTEAVVTAQQRVVDATDARAQAAQRLEDAGQRVIQSQERSAQAELAIGAARERVALAEEGLTEARQRAAAANLAIDTAERDGAASVAEARESASRRVRSALEAEADAERALSVARLASMEQASATASAVDKAFADLSPSQAAFAKYWFGLKPFFDGLTETFASRFFPGLMRGLDGVVAQGAALTNIYAILGSTFGAAAEQILGYLTSPTWVSFFTFLAEQAQQYLPALIDVFFQFLDVVRILITAFAPYAPVALQVLSLFAQLLQVLAPVIAVFAGELIPVAGLFIQALMPLAPLLLALLPVFQVLGTLLAQVVLVVLQALTPIIIALTPLIAEFARQWGEGLVQAIILITPLLVTIFTYLSENAETVVTITTVALGFLGALKFLLPILGLVAASLATFVIVRLITTFLIPLGGAFTVIGRILLFIISPFNAFKTVLGLLRLLLPNLGTAILGLGRAFLGFLGPVGIIITIVTTLYATNEKFRDSINMVLGVVLDLGMTLIQSLLPPLLAIFDAIAPLIPLVINALVPVLNVLIDVFIQILDAVLPPLIGLITGLLIPIITKLADIFSTVLVWVINNLVVPALKFLTGFITDVVVPIIMWLAQNIVVPMFKLIGEIITFTWQSIIKPAFDAFVYFIDNVLGPVIMWLWNNIFKPAFEGIGIIVRFLIDNVLIPALQLGQDALGAFGRFIDGVVAGIRITWDLLRGILATPINFLIDTVWNAGVVPAWEAVDRFLGGALPDVVRLNPIRYARGGVLPGYAPGRDSIPAVLSPGEAVMRPEWTRAVGRRGVDTMNEAARLGGTARVRKLLDLEGDPRRYASGGVVEPMRFAFGGVAPNVAAAGEEILRMFGPGTVYGVAGRANASDHPRGYALDFMTGRGRGDAIAGHFLQNFGRLSTKYLIWLQRINSGGGWRGMEDRGSPTANHFDHVHVSFNGGPGGPTTALNGGAEGGFSIANPIAEGAKLLTGKLGSTAKGIINTLAAPPPEWMNVPKGLGNGLVDGTTTWLNTKIDQLFPPATFGGAGSGGGAPEGSGPVVEQVRAVANKYGWGAGPEWGALSWLISHESSWNPTAQNPNSTAYGLFQFLNSTWAGVGGAKTSNPSQQAEYGLRYVKNRYKTPSGAQRFWQANRWYDTGGVLGPGSTMAYNGTGRDEYVLTAPQWGAVYDAASFAVNVAAGASRDMGGLGSGDGSSPLVGTYEAHFHGDTASGDAMRDLDHQLRVIRRRV